MPTQLKAQILSFLEGLAVAIIQLHHLCLQIRNLTLVMLQIQLQLLDLPFELDLFFNSRSKRINHRLPLKDYIAQARDILHRLLRRLQLFEESLEDFKFFFFQLFR